MPLLEQVLRNNPDTVRVVFKNFPLKKHSFARKAATAALAADKQGKFWEFHDRLFENYSAINDRLIRQTATDLGLNMGDFDRDMKDPKITDIINRDVREARVSGVNGTPSIFINGSQQKSRNLEDIQRTIDMELKRLKQ